MLRPMLESMQSQMNGSPDAMPFANPFNDASRATGAPAAPPAAPLTSTVSLASQKFKVSGSPLLRLDTVIARVNELNKQQRTPVLSTEELNELQLLSSYLHRTEEGGHTDNIDASTRLAWWTAVRKLLAQGHTSPYYFPALALFRVLLLSPTTSSETIAIKNACFDDLIGLLEMDTTPLSAAQTIVLLSVLVNAFTNRVASDLVLERAVRYLPFVFKSIAESSNTHIRVLSATLISNCCLALRMEEEMVITTLICGAVETLDRLSQQVRAPVSPAQAQTIEGVVAGVGQLLRNFEGARALSVELGLSEVLRRLDVAPGLGCMQPLLSELTALI